MKVFDCQEMPDDVRDAFFEFINSGNGIGNDVLVEWHTEMWTEESEAVGTDMGMSEETSKKFNTVNEWLLKNGMNYKEDVIISHWW